MFDTFADRSTSPHGPPHLADAVRPVRLHDNSPDREVA
jgi:hypothetical protein